MFPSLLKADRRAEKRRFAREELVYNVTEDILVALEDLVLTKKELARRLGKSRSYVSQVLSGARNMTLGSLSDICFALDIEPKVSVKVIDNKQNWETVETTRSEQPKSTKASNVIPFDAPRKWTNMSEKVAV